MAEQCVVPPLVYQLTGPLVLGYQFNWALFGVLSVQVYIYNQAGVPDGKFTKGIVYGIFILETLQTILATHDSFHQLALSWGNLEKLTGLYLAWLTLPVLTGITSAIIQCFYAWRIYILSSSKILTGRHHDDRAHAGLRCNRGGVAGPDFSGCPGHASGYLQDDGGVAWGTASCDVIISFSMVWLLSRSRRGFKQTDTILNKLIRLIVETGLATAVLAIVELTLFLTFKHNFYHVTPSLILSKLYSNSMLVLLNNRISMRYRDSSLDTQSQSRSHVSAIGERSTGTAIHVSVNRETYEENFAMVDFPGPKASPHDRDKGLPMDLDP
ncbi:hypothetical protein A0H81_02450 [Grifola frondosa]|uniref:DUF6534 domain-containing protein n=1 Tax=Grifola frondosa TaxID=5627 RepID=A0A1C7MNJ7_GRIFR|nr:hypothetical protein A0H81_02450 [Grifola frondosa]